MRETFNLRIYCLEKQSRLMSENVDFVQRIVTWLEDNKIFSRERKSNEQRAFGMLLYYAGLSYEKAGSFVHASHETVREWYQKGKYLFKGSTEKKETEMDSC